MLTRLLRGALESKLEYGRPAQPSLVCTCHETIKIVGENPDNHYLGASLDGKYDYRIWGTRGDAKWISFNLFSGGGFGGWGPGTGATLHEEQMHIEPDGTFEVVISQREHAGNWLRSEPETRSLAIRQTFLDKRNQRHAELHIERIGADGSPPAPLTAEELYLSLMRPPVLRQGRRRDRRPVGDPPGAVAERVHRRGRAARDRQVQGPADQVAPGLLRPRRRRGARRGGHAPECEYWMIALHNHWMETLDYVHHQTTLNCHTAVVEPDGSVRFVIAHRDPGVPNWLDTAGHRRGTVGVRWVGPDVVDVMPSTRVVPVASLATPAAS